MKPNTSTFLVLALTATIAAGWTLRPVSEARPKQHRKRVMFTNLDDINRVNKSASRIFGVGDGLGPGKFLCSGTGDTFYEKSTRDCYGALAFDFDEQES
jgi:hypothetical protein